MKNHKRALRRFHRVRLFKKRRNYWGWTGVLVEEPVYKMIINTPTPCSCFMCGNPRKYWKEKSIQELKFEEKCKLTERP